MKTNYAHSACLMLALATFGCHGGAPSHGQSTDPGGAAGETATTGGSGSDDETGGSGGRTVGSGGAGTGGEAGAEQPGAGAAGRGGVDAIGGAAGGEPGGAAGSDFGGAAGSEPGGAAGSETGGAAGSETGGAAGSETGGAGGSELGGAAGSETGGAAGSETGGAAGSETGGTAGSETGGTGGSATGGAAGSGTGGAGGEIGVGGDAGSGGDGGAGGEPPVPCESEITKPVVLAASSATCAVMSDGSLRCWGDNAVGQLGDGTTEDRALPYVVPGLEGVVDVDTAGHTCAVVDDGSVYCWGRNDWGQLGIGSTSGTPTLSPTQVPGISTARAVSTGGETTCAVLDDGTAMCWGRDEQGQLGSTSAAGLSSSPVPVDGLTTVADVSVGRWQTCARTDGGLAYCWGDNYVGDIGTGQGTLQYFTPAQVANLTDVVDISSGYNHSCAVVDDGHVYCWGGNEAGELGDDSTENRFAPVEVDGISNALRVTASPTDGHSCAVLDDETVRCWGGNASGQLGDGLTDPSLVPVPVADLAGASLVNAGADYTCASTEYDVYCWGNNANGQLGNGTWDETHTLLRAALTTPVQLASGRSNCAVMSDGSLRCWGANGSGQLGDGSTDNRDRPVVVAGLSCVVDASVADHTCAVQQDGTVFCWGNNDWGQLGIGSASSTPTTSPAQVPGITTARAVSTGGQTSCAVLANGTGLCWGRNEQGQLGHSGASSVTPNPVSVDGLTTLADVSVGRWQTCARLDGGEAYCWGDNYVGGCGTGQSTIQYFSPVQVANLTNVVDISAGYNHACAVVAGGSVFCWGGNEAGELGDDSTENRFLPVQVSGITNAVRVSTSLADSHSCAVLDDGSMRCWGANAEGQLGDQGTTPSLVPVPVLGIGDAYLPSAGVTHSCAVTTTQVFCWGDNALDQLGDATGEASLTPVLTLF